MSNPEFLREGAGIRDFKHPDRIVIGTQDERARAVMAELYRPLYLNAAPMLYTDRRSAMARKVSAALGGDLRDKTIALLGLTFKPNTDDMREAPSIALVRALQDLRANVRVFDPVGMEQAKSVLEDVTYCENPYQCAEAADALVIITEWEQFRALDFQRLKSTMAQAVLVDLRNIYDPEDVQVKGFRYVGIGRGASSVNLEQATQNRAAE